MMQDNKDSIKKAAQARMKKKHPGFQSVQNKIAKKQGISKDRAGAILAYSSRHASKGAKKSNPRLKKVH